jgi:hypothetical protein
MTNYTIYRLFSYKAGLYVGGEFSDIKEFFDYHIEHTFTTDNENNTLFRWRMDEYLDPDWCGESFGTIPGINRSPHYRRGVFRCTYSIKDAYGKNYPDPQGLYRLAHPPRRYWGSFSHQEYMDGYVEPLVHLPKNNVNKMVPETWSWYFRGIRTANEYRQNAAHVAEYEPEYGALVRGSRRGYNLPSAWDDKPNSVWHSRKSWKHNSKRRHQWKSK